MKHNIGDIVMITGNRIGTVIRIVHDGIEVAEYPGVYDVSQVTKATAADLNFTVSGGPHDAKGKLRTAKALFIRGEIEYEQLHQAAETYITAVRARCKELRKRPPHMTVSGVIRTNL